MYHGDAKHGNILIAHKHYLLKVCISDLLRVVLSQT